MYEHSFDASRILFAKHPLAYLEGLFSREVGWPLGPILAWLEGEGRRMTSSSRFLGNLCGRLTDLGAPIWRVCLDIRTIHPRITAWELAWDRESGQVAEKTESHGFRETVAYVGAPVQQVHQTQQMVRRRLDRLDEHDHPSLHFLAARGGTDYLAIPMVFSDGQTNALLLATDRAIGFTDLDITKFQVLTEFLAGCFEIFATRRTALALLDTYVGPRAGRRVFEGQIRRGDGETIDAAIWFSDLRDFTVLTESLPAPRVMEVLNSYFEFVNAAAAAQGGEILRFVGDALLIVFPARHETDRGRVCEAALQAAHDAFAGIATANARRARAKEPPIRFGVGLDVGEVVYGNVGTIDRLNFTVMGLPVNRAARLESLTKSLGHAVLTSLNFASKIREPLRPLGLHMMAGIKELQPVFVPEGF